MPACSLLLADDLASGPRVIIVRDDAEVPAPAPSGDGASPETGDANVDAEAGDDTLVGWWSFDQATGVNVPDLTGRGHDAVLRGNAAITLTNAHAGGAVLVFRTGGGWVDVPSLAGDAFPRSGTLSLWFRWDVMDAAEQAGVFDVWTEDRRHLFVRHANGRPVEQFQFAAQDVGPVGYPYAAGFTTPAMTWTHLVLTWDETAQATALYVDGALEASGAFSSTFAPTQQLFQLGVGLTGAIDEVRLYRRVLGAQEVSLLP